MSAPYNINALMNELSMMQAATKMKRALSLSLADISPSLNLLLPELENMIGQIYAWRIQYRVVLMHVNP